METKLIVLKQIKNNEETNKNFDRTHQKSEIFDRDQKSEGFLTFSKSSCEICGKYEQERAYLDKRLCSNCFDIAVLFEMKGKSTFFKHNYENSLLNPLEVMA